jgi:hypothetical protein
MHSDCYFKIGRTHKVCEDYARAKTLPHSYLDDVRPYAVVSDGCSGSEDTDLGARLMALSVEDTLRHTDALEEGRILSRLKRIRPPYLPDTCLDTTVLAVYPIEPDVLDIFVVGDGVVCLKTKEGALRTFVIEALPGESGKVAPFYLSYNNQFNYQRLEHFLKQGYNKRKISEYLNGKLVTEREQEIVPQDPTHRFLTRNWRLFVKIEEVEMAAVFSDGVQSFKQEVRPKFFEPVPVHDVLEQVMAIKISKGEFVVRRCQKFFNKFCVKNQWVHDDDFSMAAIWCGE